MYREKFRETAQEAKTEFSFSLKFTTYKEFIYAIQTFSQIFSQNSIQQSTRKK